MFYNRLKSKNKYLPLFALSAGVLIMVAIIATAVILIIFGKEEGFAIIAKYIVSDFGQVIYFALNENPYVSEFSTIYLPLNFLFVMPFVLLCKSNPAFYKLDELQKGMEWEEVHKKLLDYNVGLISTWQFWVSVIIFYTICFTLIALILYRIREWERKSDFVFAYLAVLCSGLFMFGLFRGTNVFVSLIFILLFVWLYRKDNRWLREIAVICLAVAGVLKIYPLFFGLLLIRDKRILDSVKTLIYFILFAIIPFAIYRNMFSTVVEYWKNLSTFVGGEDRLGEAMNISVYSVICFIFKMFNTPDNVVVIIALTFTIIIFVCSVIISIKAKSMFIAFTVISIGILIIPPVSYYYVTMFFVLPLSAFLDEWKTVSPARKRCYVGYFIIMSFLPLSVTAWYLPQCLLSIALITWEFIRVFPKRKTLEENQ